MHVIPFTKQFTKGVAFAAIALAAIGPAASAGAGVNHPQVDYSGTGRYAVEGIFARGAGSGHGVPFDGAVTFMLRTDDGTLPEPGECEDGFANFAITGKRRQHLWGVSDGTICGEFVQEPANVTHVYTAEYSIADSSKRLRDTEGWIEIRLATENRMSITLVDS